jgi:hypothetical protein
MEPIRMRGLSALGATLLVTVALSACGSSSPTSTVSAAAGGANATGSSGSSGATGVARRTALAACLKKYGVTLPSRPLGGRPALGATGASGAAGRFGPSGRFGASGARGARGGGFFGGGGFANNPAFAAALAKCGGASGGFGAARRAGFNASSAQDRAEVASYVACMKGDGVDLPTPNFSGTGSVFGTKVSTSSPAFRTANAKCQSVLKFLAPSATAGSGAPAGA